MDYLRVKSRKGLSSKTSGKVNVERSRESTEASKQHKAED